MLFRFLLSGYNLWIFITPIIEIKIVVGNYEGQLHLAHLIGTAVGTGLTAKSWNLVIGFEEKSTKSI